VDAQGKKRAVALLSVASNAALILVKIVVGLLMGSVAVLSEAIHSGFDLVAALIAYIAVRTSSKPADKEHPYGHAKVENLSGAIEAILIFVAAGWIIYEAIRKLITPKPLETIGLGVAVMAVSTAANIIVSSMLFKVGRETQSVALEADAWHHRTDVYTSAGVMAGLAVLWAGERLLPGTKLAWIDPVIAIGVALLILHAAWKLTVDSVRDLMDQSMPEDEQTWIRTYLKSLYPDVSGFHRLLTRKAGPKRFVEFHLIVEADMHVEDSHRITDRISDTMKERFGDAHVTVHVEPCDGSCKAVCLEGCLLSEAERKKIRER